MVYPQTMTHHSRARMKTLPLSLMSTETVVRFEDVTEHVRVDLGHGDPTLHDLADEERQQVRPRYFGKKSVVLTTQVVAITWQATPAIMDRQHLEGLGRQALNQGEKGTGFDVSHVGWVHIFEHTGRQEAALTMEIGKLHDHLVTVTGTAGAAPAFAEPTVQLDQLIRVIVTATGHLTNEHTINRVYHVCAERPPTFDGLIN